MLLAGQAVDKFAMKLPSPQKTGNTIVGQDRESDYFMLQEIVGLLLKDTPGHGGVRYLYSMLRKRVNARSATSKAGAVFSPNWNTFGTLPEAVAVEHLASVSDVSTAEVTNAKKTYRAVIPSLMEADMQIQGNVKSPQGVQAIWIAKNFFGAGLGQDRLRMCSGDMVTHLHARAWVCSRAARGVGWGRWICGASPNKNISGFSDSGGGGVPRAPFTPTPLSVFKVTRGPRAGRRRPRVSAYMYACMYVCVSYFVAFMVLAAVFAAAA